MIDVHAPHERTHSWRDILIHLAIVIVGILIAIGLEQAVEFLHHRHQARHTEHALYDESLDNRALVRQDLASIAEAHRLIRLNMTAVDSAASPHAAPFRPIAYLPSTFLLTPHNVAWLGVRDNNLLSILPSTVSTTGWEIDYMRSIVQDSNDRLMQRRQQVESLLHLHDSPSMLSAEERERLLVAFSDFDQALTDIRTALLVYNVGNEAALSGKPLDASTLFDRAGLLH